MKKTFKDFLADKHAEGFEGFKEEMSYDFDEWLSELSSDDFIEFAEKYVAEQNEEIRRLVVEDVPHKYQDRLLKTLKEV